VKKSLLKSNASLLVWLVRLVDPLLVIMAGWLAHRWYLHTWSPPEHYVLAMIGIAMFSFALFPLVGIYAPQRGVTLFEETGRLVNAWLGIAAVWFGYIFLSKSGNDFSRAWSLWWILFGVGAHVTLRIAIRATLRELRRRGYNRRHIVIVSAGRLGRDIALRLARAQWSGTKQAFAAMGPYKSITFKKVAPGGADIYNVSFERGDIEWRIAPLTANGKIESMFFRMMP